MYGVSVLLVVCAITFFVDTQYLGRRLGNFLVNIGLTEHDEDICRERRAEINAIYNISFRFARSRVDVMTYLPVFKINDIDAAFGFARDFGFSEEALEHFSETDYAYVFQYGGRELTVYKYLSYVVYLAERADSPAAAITVQDAITIGSEFMRKHNLPVEYKEVVANEYAGTFLVSYINKLSGLLNYAFPAIVEIDGAGNVFSVEFYHFEFERLARCGLMTMRRAFYELPTDFPEGTRIDIKRATLVYFFENSILQPAYLFEGEFEGGGAFRVFVNAAVF